MEFRTQIPVTTAQFTITHQDNIISIGSCFADCTGTFLINNKFNSLNNPFGVIFNPLSIFKLIASGLDNIPLSDPVNSEGIWKDFNFHSQVNGTSEEVLKQAIQERTLHTHEHLRHSKVLIITLGTAWVYRHKKLGFTVANCHKIPAQEFEKILLTPNEIVAAFELIYIKLKAANPNIQIIVTVSPVRHIKDTLVLNSVSKSVLRLAAHFMTTQFSECHYFPAYEALVDDLRDYRFYGNDLIHPTNMAELYVFEMFKQTYFSKETSELCQKWYKISQSIHHQVLTDNKEMHKKHLQKTLLELKELSKYIPLDTEIASIQQALA